VSSSRLAAEAYIDVSIQTQPRGPVINLSVNY
jgi:hypothetical protein